MSNRTDFQERIIHNFPPEKRDMVRQMFRDESKKTPEQKKAEREQQQRLEALSTIKALKENQIRASGLNGDQKLNTFDTYKLRGDTEQKASQKNGGLAAHNFAKNFPKVQKGLMFFGTSGIGKDHLLHAITNEILSKQKIYDIRYFYSLDIERYMLLEWQNHTDPVTRLEEVMRECHLLLIGDLHKVCGVKSEQIRNSVYRVINQAESTGKPLICASSNYTLQQFDDAFGEALGSRLADIFDWYEIKGEDKRREN